MGKGLSNFGGKQAAPFKKGGGRVARKRAVAKGMVKAAKSDKESDKSLSNVDLAHSKADPKINPATGKPWTEAEDDAWDKAHGIEDGSPEDCAIDQIRGIHDDNEHDLSNGYQPKPYDANGEGADEHIRCPHCHKGNADDARYCDQCGFKLVGAEGVTDMSNLDLSTLTTAERKALPPDAFVFPGKRAYPIHDLAHARDALARSSGKPEAPAVRAAVMKRYPGLRKG